MAKVQKSIAAPLPGEALPRSPKLPTVSGDDYAAAHGITPAFLIAACNKAGVERNVRRTVGEWDQLLTDLRRSAA